MMFTLNFSLVVLILIMMDETLILGAYHPVPCQATQFGCCWDNITKSLGPEKEGCPG